MVPLMSRFRTTAFSSLLALNAPAATTFVSGFAAAATGNYFGANHGQSLPPPSSSSCTMTSTATKMTTDDDHPSDGPPPPWKNFRPGDYYVWLYTAEGVPSSYERYEVTEVVNAGGASVFVEIEMATHFPAGGREGDDAADDDECDDATTTRSREFDVHHRMLLDVYENLDAVHSKDDWRLIRFDYKKLDEDDQVRPGGSSWEWRSAAPAGQGGENVQAFEEKFDCFAMLEQYEKREIRVENNSLPCGSGDGGLVEGRRAEKVMTATATSEEQKCTLNGELINVSRTKRHGYTGAWYGTQSAGRLCGVALVKEFDAKFSFSLIEYGNNKCGNGGAGGAVGVDVKVEGLGIGDGVGAERMGL